MSQWLVRRHSVLLCAPSCFCCPFGVFLVIRRYLALGGYSRRSRGFREHFISSFFLGDCPPFPLSLLLTATQSIAVQSPLFLIGRACLLRSHVDSWFPRTLSTPMLLSVRPTNAPLARHGSVWFWCSAVDLFILLVVVRLLVHELTRDSCYGNGRVSGAELHAVLPRLQPLSARYNLIKKKLRSL